MNEELKLYQGQLEQVQIELNKNPDNTELLNLQTELSELISLLESQLPKEIPKKQINKPVETQPQAPKDELKSGYNVGDKCQAIYPENNKYYNAIIVDSSEVGNYKFFTVQFEGYETRVTVKEAELQAYKPRPPPSEPTKKRKTRGGKNRNVPYVKPEDPNLKNIVVQQNIQTKKWKNFLNKKVLPKEKKNPFMDKETQSIGSKMTPYEKRKKHVFEQE